MAHVDHESAAALIEKIKDAKALVEINGLYEHYRGGMYKVLDIVISETTQDLHVIYQKQTGPLSEIKFARPLLQWLGYAFVDGPPVKRFCLRPPPPGAVVAP